MGERSPAVISFNSIINISSLRLLILFSSTPSPHKLMMGNDKYLLETHDSYSFVEHDNWSFTGEREMNLADAEINVSLHHL